MAPGVVLVSNLGDGMALTAGPLRPTHGGEVYADRTSRLRAFEKGGGELAVPGHGHALIVRDRRIEKALGMFRITAAAPLEEHVPVPPAGVGLLGTVGNDLCLFKSGPEVGLRGGQHSFQAARPTSEK